jgi:hypothetical protein
MTWLWRPRLFGLFLATFSAHSSALADDEPIDVTARRGRILTLQAESVGVLVADDRLWIPAMPSAPISVCGGRQCLPIAETETCEAPECPGPGTLVIAEGDIGDVDGFPDDPEDFNAELAAMRADSVLGTLAGYFGSMEVGTAEGVDFVFSIGAMAASTGDGGGLLPGPTGTIGFRLAIDDDEWEDLEQSLVGDRMRFEIHGFAVFDTGDQPPGAIQGIAFMPTLRNRVEDTVIEVPTLLGVVLPELGVIFRDEKAAFYAAFALPLRVFVGPNADFGFEVDARFGIAAWDESVGNNFLMSLSMRGGFE